MQYKQPALCARCGVNPPIKQWTVEKSSIGIHPITIIAIFFGFIRCQTKHVKFDIPCCDECHAKLDQLSLYGILSQAIIGLGGVILFLATLHQPTAWPAFFVVVVGVLAFAFVPPLINPTIGSYQDGYFRFKNPTFQRVFAELNPNLVRGGNRKAETSFWD